MHACAEHDGSTFFDATVVAADPLYMNGGVMARPPDNEASLAPTTIAACAQSAALLDALERRLREAGPYEVVRAHSARDLAGAAKGIRAAVLLNGNGARDFALLGQLQELGDDRPLVVLGGEPPPSAAGVSCWLASLPPAPVLHALLQELLASGPSSAWSSSQAFEDEVPPPSVAPAWRRKSDMILGESRATRKLLSDLDRLAPASAHVLITGESGTGKELVARALHYCGPRAREPFIAVNCAAIPESLFEAELFGHQRGAFTGAVAARAGAFEAARDGTLFLDEIGEMPRAMQPKLLRVLETSEITRLGSNDTRKVGARVVVATNRDMELEVREGRFREDLYYRLNVYPVHVEPLRERPEDIPAIVAHHLATLAARENRATPRLSPAALERLLGYRWPGNVRELVHVLSRALLVASKNVIDLEHVHLPGSAEQPAVSSYRVAKQQFEYDYYVRLLRIAGGNVALAARLADKTRKEVYDALKRIGLDTEAYRQGTGS